MITPSRSSLTKQTAVVLYSNIVVFFDFLIYLYLVEALNVAFFPNTDSVFLNKLQIFGVLAVGYLSRPFGGLFIGRFGDIKGRKPAFIVTSAFIVITSIITACLPTYAQAGIIAPILFVLARLAQGMGFAAHSVLGWVFIGEHAPKQELGLYISLVSASFLVGIIFTTFIFNLVYASLSPEALGDYAWRLLFIASALASIVTLFLSRYLEETPHFLEEKPTTTTVPSYTDVDLKHGRFNSVFLTSLFSFYIASLIVVVTLLLPNLITIRFGVDESLLGIAKVIGTLFFIIGTLFYGMVSDKGRVGRALMIGSVVLALQALLFYYVLQRTGTDYILVTYAMLGFSAGVIGLCPIIMIQLFPTSRRLTSVGVIYNVTYAITGGLLPIALVNATEYVALSPALYIVFVGFIGFITGHYIYQTPKYSYLYPNKYKNLTTKS